MPSPFPGMNPYLEAPARWRGVHTDLNSKLRATLNAQLPSGYAAEIEERLYVVDTERNIYPDVAVMEERVRPRRRKTRNGTIAVLESDPPYVIQRLPTQVREVFINIQRSDAPGSVVATLEVLSPTNKHVGGPGYDLYREKQREVLGSQVHLVEIDLLRTGEHTVAVRKEDLSARGPWHYVVCLHRAGEGDRFETWPVTLRERLPRFRVPLGPGVRDEVIDLQEVLQRCYDEGGYDRLIDYRVDPLVALEDKDAAWADALLRAKGLRGRARRSRRQ